MSVRESLWIALDADTVSAIDALARAKGITRHDAGRILLRLGIELVKHRERDASPEQLTLPTRSA
jgi:hypothetical protein